MAAAEFERVPVKVGKELSSILGKEFGLQKLLKNGRILKGIEEGRN